MGEKQFDKIDGRRQDAGNIKPVYLLADRTELFLDAALEKRDVRRNYNSVVPGAGYQVLTNANIVYNIPEGCLVVMLIQFCSLLTLSDSCIFQLGWCDAIDGGGTFYPVGHQMNLISGAAQSVLVTERCHIVPPIVVRYSDGARSVTRAVTPNDAGCTVSLGYAGFFMQE